MALGGTYDWTQDPMSSQTTRRERKRRRRAGENTAVDTTASGGQAPAFGGAGFTATPFTAPTGGTQTPTAAGAQQPSGGGGGIFGSGGLGGNLGGVQEPGQIFLGQEGSGQAIWGQLTPGGTSSNAASFYGQYFDPRTMMAASGAGGGMITNQDIMDMGAQMANELIGGPGGQMLNPNTVVQNILQLAAGATEAGAAEGGGQGLLAGLYNQAPHQQVSTIVSLLRGALASVMPEDVLEGYIQMIYRVGTQWADQMLYEDAGARPKENVATYIMGKLGASGGIANTGPGGRAYSSQQLAGGF